MLMGRTIASPASAAQCRSDEPARQHHHEHHAGRVREEGDDEHSVGGPNIARTGADSSGYSTLGATSPPSSPWKIQLYVIAGFDVSQAPQQNGANQENGVRYSYVSLPASCPDRPAVSVRPGEVEAGVRAEVPNPPGIEHHRGRGTPRRPTASPARQRRRRPPAHAQIVCRTRLHSPSAPTVVVGKDYLAAGYAAVGLRHRNPHRCEHCAAYRY